MASPLDRDTVEALYRRYGAQIERYCRRILGDAAEAADAAHEVFVTLFTGGGDFRGESSWMTYLIRIAKNECLGRLDKASNRRRLLERFGDPVPPSPMFDPAVLSDRDILRALLAREDGKTRDLVVYYYLFEMRLREVADLVGMSPMGVQKSLKRFEQRAHKYLHKQSKKVA